MELTAAQIAFIENATNPTAERMSQAKFAELHGVNPETLRRWKKTDWFRDALDERMRELHLSQDKVMDVVRAMQTAASNGDVQAAKTYLAFLERVQPMKPAQEDSAIEQMTDEELEAAWREGLAGRSR